jgi:hypothetical protein
MSDRGELYLLLPPSQFGYSVEFRGHARSISEYRHVSLDQSVGLFPPSLQWVPAVTSSPPSPVLWGRKTPPCPSRPSPVSLDGAVPLRWMRVCSPGQCIQTSRGRAHWGQACHACLLREEAGGLPGSWGIHVKACPGLGTPAAPNDLAVTVVRMLSSARLTASTSATVNDFGAAPSRPASSLPTLHPRQSPGERQGSLPACPLRRWPGWTLTSWIPSRGFSQPMFDFPPLPGLAWRDSLTYSRRTTT